MSVDLAESPAAAILVSVRQSSDLTLLATASAVMPN